MKIAASLVLVAIAFLFIAATDAIRPPLFWIEAIDASCAEIGSPDINVTTYDYCLAQKHNKN